MAANKGNAKRKWSKTERKVAQEIVSRISSAEHHTKPEGDLFVRGASRINTDLARLAEREFNDESDERFGDNGIYEFLLSPMYWELRGAFLDDAATGDKYAFVRAVWRAYHAGMTPPAP